MATVVNADANQIKLNNGQVTTAQQGGWYDGQQYWGGSLSNAGQINSQSNQQGAGQQVSNEVVAQTNPANVAYIQQQQKQNPAAASGAPGAGAYNPSSASGSGAGAGAMTGFNQPSIDLPGIYQKLYDSAGISDKEAELSAKERAYNDAVSKINDNPFLSESSRVGRQQKLSTDYTNGVANLKNDIATSKADIETQLNIQTKQFDINSQQAQLALEQFNTLLQSGAFDNASGDDIAAITRATGLSSSMIQGAVSATKAKNTPTSVIQYDDGTNQGFMVVNTNTGDIISRQTVAASKPSATSAKASKTDYVDALKQDARNGATLSQIFSIYGGYLDADQIYQLYNASSKYGADKGKISALAQYGVTQPKK